MRELERANPEGRYVKAMKKKFNRCEPCGDHVKVFLTNGGVALIDANDFRQVSMHTWHQIKKDRGSPYVRTQIRKGQIASLHRFVMRAKDGQVIDHINADTFGNRKANLRFCSVHQNVCNTAPVRNKKIAGGYIGVRKQSRLTWRAQITFDRKSIFLGTFTDPIEAAEAYDRAAIERHGKLATLNFPDQINVNKHAAQDSGTTPADQG